MSYGDNYAFLYILSYMCNPIAYLYFNATFFKVPTTNSISMTASQCPLTCICVLKGLVWDCVNTHQPTPHLFVLWETMATRGCLTVLQKRKCASYLIRLCQGHHSPSPVSWRALICQWNYLSCCKGTPVTDIAVSSHSRVF